MLFGYPLRSFLNTSTLRRTVSRRESIRDLMVWSLHQLDSSFGRYNAGRVIAGNKVPSYKDVLDREDPLRLTQRVLVNPMMSVLDYDGLIAYDVYEGRAPGLSLATVSMNSVLSAASSRVLCAMNADDAPRGIATDGFRWALAVRVGGINRICALVDLRPYYIEVLDRDRFRAAEKEDDAVLDDFIRIFLNVR